MRRFIAHVMHRLPFDDRGRRAVDETLLDWAHEEALTTSPWGRAWVTTRALAGVARSLTAAVALDVVHVPYGWLIGRLILIGTPFVALLAGRPLFDQAAALAARDVDAGTISVLLALLVPQAVAIVFPLALYWTVLYPQRQYRIPPIGVATAAFITTLLLIGWVSPFANQEFRVRAFALFSGNELIAARTMMRPGWAEHTVVDLVLIVLGEGSKGAVQRLTVVIGLISLAPVFVWLGLAASNLPARIRRHMTWTVPVAGFSGIAIFGNTWPLIFAALCVVAAGHLYRSHPHLASDVANGTV